jgi:hypothetical protein
MWEIASVIVKELVRDEGNITFLKEQISFYETTIPKDL